MMLQVFTTIKSVLVTRFSEMTTTPRCCTSYTKHLAQNLKGASVLPYPALRVCVEVVKLVLNPVYVA